MENQYSYYNPEGRQDNFQYNHQTDDPNENKKQKKPKKFPKAVAVIGFALLFGVVASATFLTSNIIGSKLLGLENKSDSTNTNSNTASAVSNTALTKSSSVVTSDVSSIVESVMPSVVSITNMSVQQIQNFFGGAYEQEVESAGTGIIIAQTDEELLIVTNNHVIEGFEALTVTFTDGTSVEANAKGTDSEHDLAVIAVPITSIPDDTMNAIAVATLGDSTKLKVGEPAIAIGNALGYGQSVTTGVISALNLDFTDSDGQEESADSAVRLIQTDAAINPGNSGGALVNANGEVIGINSSKVADTKVEGMGYAIPISDVSDIIDGLMNQKTKTKVADSKKGYLGIKGYDVTEESAQQFGMPTGVYVAEVESGGGAAEAGITKGNIITGLNGTSISSMEALQKELQYYAVGETVSVTIRIPENNGEYSEKTIEVTLGKAS